MGMYAYSVNGWSRVVLPGEAGWQTDSAITPVEDVVAIHSKAEEVGGNESELRGSNSDDADDGAVGAGNYPALPLALADQVCREQRKSARNVIEWNQISGARPMMVS